ncbi:amidohydrolase [uncultured Cellulomonas sp.]|uniref:amidohydrolase family protein n=1 Tax=uncultured Cellulomonas sp. TaxID=189682 RepID=UPI002630EB67|nr:amidohydrolase family protein [uncultured Cellulomonas sp.]
MSGAPAVVDTHVHLWDRRRTDLEYAWLDGDGAEATLGDLDGLRGVRYSVPELRAETRMHGVTQVVHMSAATSDPLAETRWLQGLGEATGWPTAIVAGCDLAAPDAAAALDGHREHDRLRGVRDMRDGSILSDDAFRRGYARLAGTDLVFCHTVGVDHVAAAVDLARAVPDVVLCVDQSGMPESRTPEYLRTWIAALAVLAAEPNVVVKISSLGVHDHDWTPQGRRPWIRALVQTFGPDRCLYGSNWPVERLYSGYGDVLGAFRSAIDDLTEGEQAAVLAGTARRVFRL